MSLDTDRTWHVLRINSVLDSRTFAHPTHAMLLIDMVGASHYEIIGLP